MILGVSTTARARLPAKLSSPKQLSLTPCEAMNFCKFMSMSFDPAVQRVNYSLKALSREPQRRPFELKEYAVNGNTRVIHNGPLLYGERYLMRSLPSFVTTIQKCSSTQ